MIRGKMRCPKCGYEMTNHPRTTGPHSQSHRINGFIQQIAMETGNAFDTVKMYAKTEAISRGYPYDTLNGKIFPYSETRISVKEASILIETIQQIAAELDITLVE